MYKTDFSFDALLCISCTLISHIVERGSSELVIQHYIYIIEYDIAFLCKYIYIYIYV